MFGRLKAAKENIRQRESNLRQKESDLEHQEAQLKNRGIFPSVTGAYLQASQLQGDIQRLEKELSDSKGEVGFLRSELTASQRVCDQSQRLLSTTVLATASRTPFFLPGASKSI